MADILIAAYGSRGDIMPLTGIAGALQRVGHRVSMTCTPDLVDEITPLGIDARPADFRLNADVDTSAADPLKLAAEMVKPRGMRQLGANLLAAMSDTPADIVLLTPFAELAGHLFAEARGIPSLGLRLQPMSATGDFPPSLLGAWSAGRVVNRAAGRSAARWFDRIYRTPLAGFRAELGLPRRSARSLRNARTAVKWPIPHGFSRSVIRTPGDWRHGLEVTGYWWPQDLPDWTPPSELVDFLDAGEAPVYVGLGSLMVPEKESARLSEVIGTALRSAGLRGIVSGGGAGLHVEGDDVLTVGTVPHSWLFPRMRAAVHSCSAGTTAASLRAGLPVVGSLLPEEISRSGRDASGGSA